MKKLICLFLLAVSVASVLYAAYPDEYPIYLRMLGFSKDDIRHLIDGSLIKRSIHNAIPGESGIIAAQVSNIPAYYFLDYFGSIENFSSLEHFGDTGRFSDPPDLQDLKPLLFSKTELQDFLICRTGPCDLKFSPEEIQTIPAEADLTTDPGIEIASNSYRRLLLKRVRDYRENGNGTAPQAADLLKSQLTRFVEVSAYFPGAQEYLLQYPNQKKSSRGDLFYWSRESVGKRTVLSLHHVFSQRVGEDYILLNYVIYSNYYFDSTIGVIHLLNYADRNRPATLIVFELRTLVRAATKGPGRSGKSLEDHWTSRLKTVTETLETRYGSREYLGFPYQLFPRDQR